MCKKIELDQIMDNLENWQEIFGFEMTLRNKFGKRRKIKKMGPN